MNSKIVSLIALFALGQFSIMVHAQDAPKERFRALAWQGYIQDLFMTQSELPKPDPEDPSKPPVLDPNYKETSLLISDSFISNTYDYDPTKPVKLVRHVGTNIQLVAQMDLSQAPHVPLLFLFPGKTAGTYEISIIPEDLASFPGGSFMSFNFSSLPTMISFVGDKSTTSKAVKPGAREVLQFQGKLGDVFNFQVVTMNNNNRVYSSNWAFTPSVRYLIFLMNDPHRPGSVMFTRIPDNPDSIADPKPN